MIIKFHQEGLFAACHAAEDWCRKNGFSVGCMQGSDPRGILARDILIGKWRNLSPSEKERLDGIMTGNMRYGPIAVEIKEIK